MEGFDIAVNRLWAGSEVLPLSRLSSGHELAEWFLRKSMDGLPFAIGLSSWVMSGMSSSALSVGIMAVFWSCSLEAGIPSKLPTQTGLPDALRCSPKEGFEVTAGPSAGIVLAVTPSTSSTGKGMVGMVGF